MAAPQRAAPQRAAPQRSVTPQAATRDFRRGPDRVNPRGPDRVNPAAGGPAIGRAPDARTIDRATRRELRQEQRQEQRLGRQELRQNRQDLRDLGQNRQDMRALQRRERAQRALDTNMQQRQTRIDRLQERVQGLQAQQPQGARAQRAQQRLLQAQQRQLQREQRVQQRDQAVQQRWQQGPQARDGRFAGQRENAWRGRFASRFQGDGARDWRWRQAAGLAPRYAWRRGLPAVFVPWLAGVYWPYAYSDIFEYTFWPRAYDAGYWAYAYDDFIDTVFWGAGGPYDAYAYGPGEGPGMRARGAAPPASQRTVQQLCGDPDKGITAWPFADIERAVQPNEEQRRLLDEMKQAAAEAAQAFRQSCGGSFPMTPPGRLASMTRRIDATLQAVRTVRPALERFYESLSDEQKARFNAVGPESQVASNAPQQEQANNQTACGEPKPGLTNLPIERIDEMIRPTGEQQAALERLRGATEKAVATLQAACPDATPLTPVGRLEAMEQRLEAMLTAANTVQPALEEFYAALSNEQKARFNRLNATASR
jgi:hypothetical protein